MIDPFMGSGSVGVAAAKLGRRFAGTDVNPEAVRLTAQRLGEFGPVAGPSELLATVPTNLLALADSRS